ncbi:uncharacterized protein LOC118646643 [Monomorium pharaonis]|uniref:uncharacterized protein LOC118646643 n=1 Tax=Monomorium pharaonis TaxID=307658 RepID=UPI001747C749|nr:uncharacterized protein LOC118646643 [Monomorium pharaonis]
MTQCTHTHTHVCVYIRHLAVPMLNRSWRGQQRPIRNFNCGPSTIEMLETRERAKSNMTRLTKADTQFYCAPSTIEMLETRERAKSNMTRLTKADTRFYCGSSTIEW